MAKQNHVQHKNKVLEDVASGLTTKELSEKYGIPVNTINKWKCDINGNSSKILNRHAEVLFNLAIKDQEIKDHIFEMALQDVKIKTTVVDMYMDKIQSAV